jgi:hypothetical protein
VSLAVQRLLLSPDGDLRAGCQNALQRPLGDQPVAAARLGFRDLTFIPVSALVGDNVRSS